MKITVYFQIVIILALCCLGANYARERYWKVQDLVGQADIVATVSVKQIRKEDNDFEHIDLIIDEIFKANNNELNSLTLKIPILSGSQRPKPVSFIIRGRYMVFLKFADAAKDLQSLQLISPTSGAVLLQGNEVIMPPSFLDGFFSKHRKFNEPQLIQRVRELVVDGPSYYALNDGKTVWDTEKQFFTTLGLSKDVNESDIIELLDVLSIRSLVIGLIRHRKISSASDHLLKIVNNKEISLLVRISAAEALCDFKNKMWLETLRPLLTDPNSILDVTLKIKIAGLMACVGDYSRFEMLTEYITHSEWYIRLAATRELGNFWDKECKESLAAADILVSAAKSDSETWVRLCSIRSLEKIVEQNPDLTTKLQEAAKANLNSYDPNLSSECKDIVKHFEKE